MATKKIGTNPVHTKKQFKKELAQKIETALPEIKEGLGKKKFNKRVKKVTKLLTSGLHLNGADKKAKKNISKKSASIKKVEPVKKDVVEENANLG